MVIQIAQFLPEEILYHCGNLAYTALLQQNQYLRRQLDESNRQRDTCIGEIKGTKCVYYLFFLRIIFIAFTEPCTTYFSSASIQLYRHLALVLSLPSLL